MYLVLGGVPGPGGCTWSQGGVHGPRGGVPGPGGCVPGPASVAGSRGVYLVPGGSQVLSSPVNRITNWCKNITLSKTSFAGGKNLTRHRNSAQYTSVHKE